MDNVSTANESLLLRVISRVTKESRKYTSQFAIRTLQHNTMMIGFHKVMVEHKAKDIVH